MTGLEDCAQLCMNCAHHCNEWVEAMQEGSNSSCLHCEASCEACASVCEKFDFEFTRRCTSACLECAQACRESAVAA